MHCQNEILGKNLGYERNVHCQIEISEHKIRVCVPKEQQHRISKEQQHSEIGGAFQRSSSTKIGRSSSTEIGRRSSSKEEQH